MASSQAALWERGLCPRLEGKRSSFVVYQFSICLGTLFPHPSSLHTAMMMRDAAESMLLCSETVQGIEPADWGEDGWEAVGWCVQSSQAWVSTSVPTWNLASPPGCHGEKEDILSHDFLCLSTPLCCHQCWPSPAPLLSFTDSPISIFLSVQISPTYGLSWGQPGSNLQAARLL